MKRRYQHFDTENSLIEDRYLLLGCSVMFRIVLVSYSELAELEVIRIISARKASAKEKRHYPN
jgi:uncharacterized DUF497 family protein|tara:strand:+ start:429 stop:617 length:189 start_codon:yes stop_codon:yes gene_type:complete